ncbi:MAG: alpha/beta hydrolase [Gammaproteobacteria bacterium]|nr:alpha/beta hydrolase [Gammaproteobacteria bacterium]
MITFIRLLSILLLLFLYSCSHQQLTPSGVEVGTDTSQLQYHPRGHYYKFDKWAGKPLTVYYYLPEKVNAETPLLFVMHGQGRDANRYLRQWIPLAKSLRFILVVPEFSNKKYPKSRSYNLGNMFTQQGKPVNREQWSFSAIEPLFDDIQARTGNKSSQYNIYGHSAGAQFVHRFLYFEPDARVNKAVSANAGWYTMPSYGQNFPYGIQGADITKEQLKKTLAKSLTVLLGSNDTDSHHSSLRRTPEAMAQGKHRFERGQRFYFTGKNTASVMGVEFGWNIYQVTGVAHDNGLMVSPAAKLLYQPEN